MYYKYELIICYTSISLQLFFRNKVQEEEGYILFVRKNALQILIPKFGLEGTLYLNKKGETSAVTFVYNEEEHTQSSGEVVFRSFDQVIVQLSLDRSNVQHEKLVFQLVKPVVSLLFCNILFFNKVQQQ